MFVFRTCHDSYWREDRSVKERYDIRSYWARISETNKSSLSEDNVLWHSRRYSLDKVNNWTNQPDKRENHPSCCERVINPPELLMYVLIEKMTKAILWKSGIVHFESVAIQNDLIKHFILGTTGGERGVGLLCMRGGGWSGSAIATGK